MKIVALFSIFLGYLGLITPNAEAQVISGGAGSGLSTFITTTHTAALYVGVALLFLMFFYGFILYIISRGESEQISYANSIIIDAIIGFLLLLLIGPIGNVFVGNIGSIFISGLEEIPSPNQIPPPEPPQSTPPTGGGPPETVNKTLNYYIQDVASSIIVSPTPGSQFFDISYEFSGLDPLTPDAPSSINDPPSPGAVLPGGRSIEHNLEEPYLASLRDNTTDPNKIFPQKGALLNSPLQNDTKNAGAVNYTIIKQPNPAANVNIHILPSPGYQIKRVLLSYTNSPPHPAAHFGNVDKICVANNKIGELNHPENRGLVPEDKCLPHEATIIIPMSCQFEIYNLRVEVIPKKETSLLVYIPNQPETEQVKSPQSTLRVESPSRPPKNKDEDPDPDPDPPIKIPDMNIEILYSYLRGFVITVNGKPGRIFDNNLLRYLFREWWMAKVEGIKEDFQLRSYFPQPNGGVIIIESVDRMDAVQGRGTIALQNIPNTDRVFRVLYIPPQPKLYDPSLPGLSEPSLLPQEIWWLTPGGTFRTGAFVVAILPQKSGWTNQIKTTINGRECSPIPVPVPPPSQFMDDSDEPEESSDDQLRSIDIHCDKEIEGHISQIEIFFVPNRKTLSFIFPNQSSETENNMFNKFVGLVEIDGKQCFSEDVLNMAHHTNCIFDSYLHGSVITPWIFPEPSIFGGEGSTENLMMPAVNCYPTYPTTTETSPETSTSSTNDDDGLGDMTVYNHPIGSSRYAFNVPLYQDTTCEILPNPSWNPSAGGATIVQFLGGLFGGSAIPSQ